MSVKLFLSRNLTYLAKGKDVFEVNGETVGECLNHLVSLVPVMKKTLFYESGDRLYPHVQVQVNKKSANAEGLTKQVNDGDEIHILLKWH
ncbi:MAG: MoaD/ThiS family protein [Deltaproteobacteria bacterium]|nr:MoaD/ThiS family protein [Deltaproteobacteria bacterium]